MKTLMDRFKEQLEKDELEDFVNKLENTDEGQAFEERIEEMNVDPDLAGLIGGVFITNAYLLAKVSELEDEIIYLKSQTHNLM